MKQEKDETKISSDDDAKLDADLLEIEILYKTRCVSVPKGSNVVVREIPDSERK